MNQKDMGKSRTMMKITEQVLSHLIKMAIYEQLLEGRKGENYEQLMRRKVKEIFEGIIAKELLPGTMSSLTKYTAQSFFDYFVTLFPDNNISNEHIPAQLFLFLAKIAIYKSYSLTMFGSWVMMAKNSRSDSKSFEERLADFDERTKTKEKEQPGYFTKYFQDENKEQLHRIGMDMFDIIHYIAEIVKTNPKSFHGIADPTLISNSYEARKVLEELEIHTQRKHVVVKHSSVLKAQKSFQISNDLEWIKIEQNCEELADDLKNILSHCGVDEFPFHYLFSKGQPVFAVTYDEESKTINEVRGHGDSAFFVPQNKKWIPALIAFIDFYKVRTVHFGYRREDVGLAFPLIQYIEKELAEKYKHRVQFVDKHELGEDDII